MGVSVGVDVLWFGVFLCSPVRPVGCLAKGPEVLLRKCDWALSIPKPATWNIDWYSTLGRYCRYCRYCRYLLHAVYLGPY